MDDDDAVVLAAAQIIGAESIFATLQRAISTTIRPLIHDTIGTMAAQVANLDQRITQLEKEQS